MIVLVPKVEDEPIERLWLVFFGDPVKRPWWGRLMRPGFRHVCAASYYASRETWVYFDPLGSGTVIQLYPRDMFGPRMTALVNQSAAILRIKSRQKRLSTPFGGWLCTGAVKGLLGIRSRALLPRGLYRDLLARGAEIVDVPREDHGSTVRQ